MMRSGLRSMGSKVVVYTVIIGNYDVLRPTRWPSVCLTDGSVSPAEGWEIRRIAEVHLDPRRASRHPKILAHEYFPGAETTIYLDGNIDLLCDPSKVVDELLREHSMALFPHPQRTCVYAEAKKCLRLHKANPTLVEAQMAHYRKKGLPKNFGLTACWVIVRRNTPKVREFSEMWWREYSRFSCRDQLSFDFVRWQTKMEYTKIPGNLFVGNSKCFRKVEHAS